MAGRGPAPKSKSNRVRSEAPGRGEWIRLSAVPWRGKKPALPRVKGGLLAVTKEEWAAWWASPMAHMWTRTDWADLMLAIGLFDRITRAINAGEAKNLGQLIVQYRLLRDQLGLSRKGRQELRWRLPEDPDGDHDYEDDEDGPKLAAVVDLPPARKRPDPRSAS